MSAEPQNGQPTKPQSQRGVFLDEKAFHEYHTQAERLRSLRRELTKTRVKTVLGIVVDAVADAEPSSGPSSFSFDGLPALVEGFKAKLEAAGEVDQLRDLLRKYGTHTADCAAMAVDVGEEPVDCSCGWDEIEAGFAEEDKEREVAEAAAEAAKAAAARQDAPVATVPPHAEAAPSAAEADSLGGPIAE
jgi:hypothetical protein